MSKKGLGFIERMVAKLVIKKVVKLINQYVMEKSWKTTATGWGTLVIALLVAGVALIDGDPATVPDADAIFKALSTVGIAVPIWLQGIFARDKDVSSEEQAA